MTRMRLVAAGVAVALIASVPVTPAFAFRHHGGPFFWPFAAGAAVLGAAATIATAPFAAIAPPAPYPGYGYGYPPGPAPGYYAPPPGYYAPYGYYGPPPR